MKVVFLFNMANDGWCAVKGLRSIGVDAQLLTYWPCHVASLPHWEEAEHIDLEKMGDTYAPNMEALKAGWQMPSWCHIFNSEKSFPFSRRIKFARAMLSSMLRDADVVIGVSPFERLVPFFTKLFPRKPFIIYDAGWIRYLQDRVTFPNRVTSPHLEAGRDAYRKAPKVLFTNVDTYEMLVAEGLEPSRLTYSPFSIDTELYNGSSANPRRDSTAPTFFTPTRPDWCTKRGERLLLAFARYLQRFPKARLTAAGWTKEQPEFNATRVLCQSLGIEENVRWLEGIVNKRLLVREYYQPADVLFDQFELGAFGSAAQEMMACGKPVCGYAEPAFWNRWHGSTPPVLQARTVDEIHQRMVEMEDPSLRRKYGDAARRWVLENCEMKKVGKLHLAVCEEVLRR